jgi:hypothetical protein
MDVYETELDWDALSALADDLEACAEVLAVRGKGIAMQHSENEGTSALRDALAALRAGRLHGVRIDYRWNGGLWTDTLLAGPRGARVVRAQASRDDERERRADHEPVYGRQRNASQP